MSSHTLLLIIHIMRYEFFSLTFTVQCELELEMLEYVYCCSGAINECVLLMMKYLICTGMGGYMAFYGYMGI